MNRLRFIMVVMGCIASLYTPHVAVTAETLDDIYALADRKEFDTALQHLNTFLAAHPKDAQGRFLQGLILTETKKSEQAIAVFTQLSKDFPELPEPYNNLAVLYAEQGQFEKAQEALIQAVKAHPNYATAHENLGDIYAKMSSQSYARALKLNQGNTALINKLNKVKTLFAEGIPDASAPSHSAVTSPHPAIVKEAVTPQKTVPLPPKSVTQSGTSAAKKSETTTVTQPQPVPPPASKAEQDEKSTDPKTIQEVQQTIHAWASAWSAKNVSQYLGAYSAKFQPISKTLKTREAWEKNRRDVLNKPGTIQVQVTDLQIIMLNENRTQATFQQNYTSKNFRDQVKKTLSLERENSTWKIVREYADE